MCVRVHDNMFDFRIVYFLLIRIEADAVQPTVGTHIMYFAKLDVGFNRFMREIKIDTTRARYDRFYDADEIIRPPAHVHREITYVVYAYTSQCALI